MDPNKKITKKFTKNFDTDVDNRQYFHRKTALKTAYLLFRVGTFNSFLAGSIRNRVYIYSSSLKKLKTGANSLLC